uniref:Endonuclease/exonuclease/phosphatase family domain-containing protein 1 n=1 Tax=Hyaloperonospora arabidopsidis (strain Emoy2) TaxID=559515 RepID=M4C167_HYAAE
MDLNSASHRELLLLPGVGRVTAQLIIKSRPFTSVQDLLSVKGIGPVKFTAIVSQNRVYVDESTFDTTNAASRAAQINLNTASSRQLQRLRGVGPVLAQRIVEARPFHRKEDLLAVEGIGSKSYLKMQEQAHVPLEGAVLQQRIEGEDGNVKDFRSELEEQQFYFCREIERDVRGNVFPTRGRDDGDNRALIVGSWNIRNISRRKETFLLQRIADVLSEFDLVALQEVRDLIVLKKLKTMLPGWNYVVSSPVGSKVTGTKARNERYAFVFRRCMVRIVDKCSLIEDKNDVLTRLPCIATFRATRQSGVSDLELSLINVHVSFGEKARRRDEIAEINQLANEMSVSACGTRKVVVLGDFNLSLQDVLGRPGSDKMALIRSPLSTTVFGKLYDNIWLDRSDFSGPQVYDGERRYRVASGVLRVDWQYYPFSKGSRHRVQGSMDTMLPQLKTYMSRVQCGYELSDHCPVWVAFTASACYDAVDGKAMSEPK